ncbi:hypothetical protein SLS58_010512 [Diplodia intermedia]|uniref:RNase H type-1 domain-containing protein n=1 Tax=Diplodia intermedia TaxID=856260 RepID=A0ABR3T5K4_9PEZI
MQTTGPAPANVGLPDNRIYGTQRARSLNLLVHADRLPDGRLDHDASVAFAHRAANHVSTLVMYGDGSGNHQNHWEPKWTGVAAAWKRRDELLYHVVGRRIKREMFPDEMEAHAVNECMSTALVERWRVEEQVVVLTDNIVALQEIRDWVPGQGGAKEAALQRLKRLDDLFAAQGVPVVVRFLKGRRFVEGHDVADVMARQLSCQRKDPKWSGDQEYREREEYIYSKMSCWFLAVNNSAELNANEKRSSGFGM